MKEIWKKIPGHQKYSVSLLGKVRRDVGGKGNTYAGRIMRPHVGPEGYLSVHFHPRKTMLVHRIVMAAFVGRIPEGKVVNHIDFNRANNRLGNLEYVTGLENAQHSARNARWKTKLKVVDVKVIRSLLKNGVLQSKIAKQFNVDQSAISNINRKADWGWLPEEALCQSH